MTRLCQPRAGKWRLVKAPSSEQIWVEVDDVLIGQVNRRAAAILAPLLDGDLIYVEVQQNQEAEGRSSKALYIFAKLGVRGNKQVCLSLSSLLRKSSRGRLNHFGNDWRACR